MGVGPTTYEEVEDCVICKHRAKQLSKLLIILPAHIARGMMTFAGSTRCEKEPETIVQQ